MGDRQMRIFCHSGMGRMTVGTAYFKSASYFIFMYDVCDLRSFKECQNLLNHVVRHGPSERPPIFMIANKIDEYADPAWASQTQWEPPGLAASPENGTGVDEFFDKLYKILQPPVVQP